MKLNDLAGQRFGHWTVIERANNKLKSTMWLCKCDCGNIKPVSAINLTRNTSTNCGCLRIEATKKATTTHGKHGTRLYGVWKDMRSRCNNPNANDYKYYGGKGICICDEWNSFQNFWNWATANGYEENAPLGKCTIDRVDVNSNYCPSNCRWVDMKTQSLNKTSSRRITA